MEKNISIKPAIIASIVLLLLAILPWPYGYYTLLRLVVCFTAAFLGWFSYKKQRIRWVWIMSFIALVFNPFVPLHFGRELWLMVDIIAAILFGVFLLKNKREV